MLTRFHCSGLLAADEMCELFISRGAVSLLISLTLTEEPEEVFFTRFW